MRRLCNIDYGRKVDKIRNCALYALLHQQREWVEQNRFVTTINIEHLGFFSKSMWYPVWHTKTANTENFYFWSILCIINVHPLVIKNLLPPFTFKISETIVSSMSFFVRCCVFALPAIRTENEKKSAKNSKSTYRSEPEREKLNKLKLKQMYFAWYRHTYTYSFPI